MNNQGGARPNSGRPKGSKNRATAQARARLSELASEYSNAALDALAHVAKHGESENARVSAACALLDRAHGKPVQATELSGPDGGPVEHQSPDVSEAKRKLMEQLSDGADGYSE